jgi:putative transcriptional regulator
MRSASFQLFAMNGVESAADRFRPWVTRRRLSPVKKAFRTHRSISAALLVILLLPAWLRATPAAGTPPGAAASGKAPGHAMTAILLVAQGAVSDPNFEGSIVVVMNNIGPAPVGIIINRPMPLPVSRFFPKVKHLAQARDKVYFGGPVEFGDVWFLFRARTAPATAFKVCEGVYVSWDGKLLLKMLKRGKPLEGLRLFIGHAGWAPGQLQAEIAAGAWVPKRVDVNSIFNPQPVLPWPAHRGPKTGT